jgi:hypothetical protein
MKTLSFTALIVAFAVLKSSAQKFEFGIDFGYGLGIGDTLVNSLKVSDNDTTMLENSYGTRGNGYKITGQGVFYLNENFGIIAMSGYSWSGGYSDTESVYNGLGRALIDYKDVFKRTSSCVSVNLGLKFRTRIWKIMPYIYAAPGLYFPQEKETISSFFFGSSTDPETTIRTYSFSPGFGFTAGIGAAITVFDRIGVKVEIAPTYAYANVTQYTERTTNILMGFNTTQTYIFKKNGADPAPANPAPNTTYISGQPRHEFNSVAFKLGVYYSF